MYRRTDNSQFYVLSRPVSNANFSSVPWTWKPKQDASHYPQNLWLKIKSTFYLVAIFPSGLEKKSISEEQNKPH